MRITISNHSPLSPLPSPQQPTYFLKLPIQDIHINTCIRYIIFCVWLLSLSLLFLKFIHIVAWINTSLHFMAGYYPTEWIEHTCLSIHQVVGSLTSWSGETTASGKNVVSTTLVKEVKAKLSPEASFQNGWLCSISERHTGTYWACLHWPFPSGFINFFFLTNII